MITKTAARAHAPAPTVSALATRYLRDRRRLNEKERTLAQCEDIVDRLIGPALGARKAVDVIRRDVERLIQGLAGTPRMANRVRTVLAAVFAFAEREELRAPHTNPVAGVERHPEPWRARSLTEAEYAALGTALARADGPRGAACVVRAAGPGACGGQGGIAGARAATQRRVVRSAVGAAAWAAPAHGGAQAYTVGSGAQ